MANLFALVLNDMSTVCDVRVAVVRFLECARSFYFTEQHSDSEQTQTADSAVHFGVMFDAHMSGAKYASFECRSVCTSSHLE